MEFEPVSVRMLGEFVICQGDREISNKDNRSRNIWLLLAHMIYCRERTVTPEETVALLWGEDERTSNPLNALKTMLHRVRSCLNQLGGNIGHSLILRRGGAYVWNNDIPLTLDAEEFERLCQAGSDARDPEDKLALWLQALPMYRGHFLERLSSDPWVVPLAAYYHELYLHTVMDAIPLLERRERWTEVAQLCTQAVKEEPHREDLYRHLMTALIRTGEQQTAVAVYEQMSARLLAELGLMPSDDLRALYHDALRYINDRTVSAAAILESLREPSDPGGALVCDYDFFKAIYQSVARMVERSGEAVHLALISIAAAEGDELPRRSLDRVVENLQVLIRTHLRRGDVAARCSVSQFVLLLPQANYEDSSLVCDRIVKAFNRQYPHSPAALTVSVVPLEPNVQETFQ